MSDLPFTLDQLRILKAIASEGSFKRAADSHFGKEGGKRLAEEYDIPYLGQIPLVQTIREGGDEGVPVMMSDDEVSKNAFLSFAGTAARSIAMRNADISSEKRAEIVEM